MKMIVIADDFTGSNDTGVQLAKKGARTEVMLTPDQKPSRRADVLVINTESRAMPAAEAGKAVAQALAPWCDGDARPLVYKKIDSTFRGNVGAEVTAAMRAANRKLAVIAAAIPAAGRTTRDGLCLVNGTQELPVLVVAGSMSEATRRQVEKALCQARASVVDIDASRLASAQYEQEMAAAVEQACALLSRQQHTILRTSRSADDRQMIDGLCAQAGLSRQQLGEMLSERLGMITLRIIEQARIGGLFLTGGDIATAVAAALGAEGYRIQSEVAPCIPCGTFVNSEIDDLPVITKAGGFGSDSTLCDALYFIEEMYSGN